MPAVARTPSTGVQCARCQQPLTQPQAAAGQKPPVAGAEGPDDAVVFEPWKLADVLGPDDTQRMREIRHQLRSAQAHSRSHTPAERTLRIDPPAAATRSAAADGLHQTDRPGQAATGWPAGFTLPTPTPGPTPQRAAMGEEPHATPRDQTRPGQLAAWCFALLGAVLLGAGIGLLGWSLAAQRGDLWDWGLAATLGGQGLMIVGLVQLLANLWTGSRDATARLIRLQYEVRRLQRSADSLAGMHTATPSAFYADLAKGSSPHVLLAGLRGQVEELTSRLADG
ncbi:MAG: hypothetical protein AAF790_03230 [Planctomycetota bacterium]